MFRISVCVIVPLIASGRNGTCSWHGFSAPCLAALRFSLAPSSFLFQCTMSKIIEKQTNKCLFI